MVVQFGCVPWSTITPSKYLGLLWSLYFSKWCLFVKVVLPSCFCPVFIPGDCPHSCCATWNKSLWWCLLFRWVYVAVLSALKWFLSKIFCRLPFMCLLIYLFSETKSKLWCLRIVIFVNSQLLHPIWICDVCCRCSSNQISPCHISCRVVGSANAMPGKYSCVLHHRYSWILNLSKTVHKMCKTFWMVLLALYSSTPKHRIFLSVRVFLSCSSPYVAPLTKHWRELDYWTLLHLTLSAVSILSILTSTSSRAFSPSPKRISLSIPATLSKNQ